jgi:hypothetical protein
MAAASGQRTRTSSTTPASLGRVTAGRLHHQIERAVQRTFGATSGLRILVEISTREMLAAGASREAIRAVLADSVARHAAAPAADAAASATSDWQWETLTNSMYAWADQVCADMIPVQKSDR